MQQYDELKVPVEHLRHTSNPDGFSFVSTAEVPPLVGMIGQERAVRALDFGLNVNSAGYNIYMAGPPGTGKTTYALSVARQAAAKRPVPNDWVYVHNFRNEDCPQAIELKPGMGRQLREDMENLVDDLRVSLPQALTSEQFEEQRQNLLQEFQAKSEAVLTELSNVVQAAGFQLRRTATGFLTIPLLPDGQPMTPDQFNRLDPSTRDMLEKRSHQLQPYVADALRNLRSIETEARARLQQLERDAALAIVQPLVERLRSRYRDVPAAAKLAAYFDAVQEDVINNLSIFSEDPDGTNDPGAAVPAILAARARAANDRFIRYRVNVLVDHGDSNGAPVVLETMPEYYNLVGKQEYAGQAGIAATNLTMIKAGALHAANGGYLILQARDLLANTSAWDALKRALKTAEIRIEAIGEQYRLVPVRTMRPEPIPLNVKVILIGTPQLFHLLHQMDEDFRKLFKIKAEFDVEMDRNDETTYQYAMFISSLCRREGLRDFDRTAVAKVIEHSSRLAGDQNRVTTRFNAVVEILYEAAAWAEQEDAELVSARHVERAVAERQFRNNRIEQKLQEQIARGKILVAVEGAVVGQVNGLSVINVGDYQFGRPSRITARTYMGDAGVVNIEREIDLSGSIHAKGVLTLVGYLGAMYAQRRPLTLSASLTFEQLYEGVDGDSASSAELYALLSSLAEVPLRQDLAVTGSVDQYGRIQPVGGVNEKIEGFFRVCAARGLTGSQGVIIPEQNVDNLMLDPGVVAAVGSGRFHIYAIRTIDQGLALLTGIEPGSPNDSGDYPPESIHGRVAARLERYARGMADFKAYQKEI